MQFTSVTHLTFMLCATSLLNHFWTGHGIHEAVNVLASVIFGLMALRNLAVSIHNWLFFNICPLIFLHFSTKITSSSSPNFFALLSWLYVTLWYVVLIHGARDIYVRYTRSRILRFRSIYISREYCLLVRCHKFFKPGSMAENSRGAKCLRCQLHLSS